MASHGSAATHLPIFEPVLHLDAEGVVAGFLNLIEQIAKIKQVLPGDEPSQRLAIALIPL
jgi:hypothetical protein